MTKEEIKKIIPHRDPFLFVERITDLNLEKMSAIGYMNFNEDLFFYQGHFPNKPVTPGVILIEAAAQVGAVILLSNDQFKGKIALFAGIKKAKFRKMVLPGEEVKMVCQLTKIKGVFGVGEVKSYVDDKLVLDAEFSFAIS